MLRAIIRASICKNIHPSHGVKAGEAYPVTKEIDEFKRIKVMTPGGRVLAFNQGEYDLIEDERG